MSRSESGRDEESPPCPVCDSTSADEIVLRVAPDDDLYGDPDVDLYGDPDLEATVRERPFVRCNNCGVLFDAKVRRRHSD